MTRAMTLRLGTVLLASQLVSCCFAPVKAEGGSPGAQGAELAQSGEQPSLRKPLDQPPQAAPASEPPGAGVAQPALSPQLSATAMTVRKDSRLANKIASDPRLFKMAQADPSILAAICEHPGAAKRLAKNRHLGELAEDDHYLCRRLTRWPGATWALVQNPEADKVVALDPEGIYRAIDRDPAVALELSKNVMFHQMITENPDLGKVISLHM